MLGLVAPGVWHAGASMGAATPYSPTGQYSNGALLPNGRLVNPVGTVVPVGDFPVAVVPSPRGDIAVVSNAGQGEGGPEQGNESLVVVDLSTDRVVQTIADHTNGKDTFYNEGVAFSPDGSHVYVTGGGNDRVYDYSVNSVSAGRLSLRASWVSTRKAGLPQLPEAANVYGYPRNVAVSPDGKRVFVTNEQGGSVSALDTRSGAIVWETQLPGVVPLGSYPAGVAVTPSGRSVYVASQGQNVMFTLDSASGLLKGSTPVGDHPVAVAVTRGGPFGFVANDNDDSLSILDLSGALPTTAAQLSLHLFAGEANGSAPNAVAVDEARKLVYVANAGDDAIAVVGESLSPAITPATWNPSKLKVLGYLPTAWYPTGVSVLPSDGSVLAVSAKGYGGVPVTDRNQYDGNDMVGLFQHMARPDAGAAIAGKKKALDGLRFATDNGPSRPPDGPIPDAAHAGQSPIKHVVLVVRENRTFDQVFGDLPAWAGTASMRILPSSSLAVPTPRARR
jgi:YVTN family beta-propeller protein